MTEKKYSTEELMLAVAIRQRSIQMSSANHVSDDPVEKSPQEWVMDAIDEAKRISDLIAQLT